MVVNSAAYFTTQTGNEGIRDEVRDSCGSSSVMKPSSGNLCRPVSSSAAFAISFHYNITSVHFVMRPNIHQHDHIITSGQILFKSENNATVYLTRPQRFELSVQLANL
jgi:hypothetical protein